MKVRKMDLSVDSDLRFQSLTPPPDPISESEEDDGGFDFEIGADGSLPALVSHPDNFTNNVILVNLPKDILRLDEQAWHLASTSPKREDNLWPADERIQKALHGDNWEHPSISQPKEKARASSIDNLNVREESKLPLKSSKKDCEIKAVCKNEQETHSRTDSRNSEGDHTGDHFQNVPAKKNSFISDHRHPNVKLKWKTEHNGRSRHWKNDNGSYKSKQNFQRGDCHNRSNHLPKEQHLFSKEHVNSLNPARKLFVTPMNEEINPWVIPPEKNPYFNVSIGAKPREDFQFPSTSKQSNFQVQDQHIPQTFPSTSKQSNFQVQDQHIPQTFPCRQMTNGYGRSYSNPVRRSRGGRFQSRRPRGRSNYSSHNGFISNHNTFRQENNGKDDSRWNNFRGRVYKYHNRNYDR